MHRLYEERQSCRDCRARLLGSWKNGNKLSGNNVPPFKFLLQLLDSPVWGVCHLAADTASWTIQQQTILPSRMSRNNTSCRRTCPSHVRFCWFIVLMMLLFSLTRFKTSALLTFAVQLIFSIFLHIHISKASILFITVFDIVHVSDAHKATLHTRHLIWVLNAILVRVKNMDVVTNPNPKTWPEPYIIYVTLTLTLLTLLTQP